MALRTNEILLCVFILDASFFKPWGTYSHEIRFYWFGVRYEAEV